jgi:hypothetical protein
VFVCILALLRITQSGSWKTDPSFLRWLCHIRVIEIKVNLIEEAISLINIILGFLARWGSIKTAGGSKVGPSSFVGDGKRLQSSTRVVILQNERGAVSLRSL